MSYNKNKRKNRHNASENAANHVISSNAAEQEKLKVEEEKNVVSEEEIAKDAATVATSESVKTTEAPVEKTEKSAETTVPAGKTEDSDVKADLAGETEDSDVKADPTGETEDSDVKADPAGETEDSDVEADHAGETENSDVKADSAGETEDSDVKADPAGKTEDSDVKADPAGETKAPDGATDSAGETKAPDGTTVPDGETKAPFEGETSEEVPKEIPEEKVSDDDLSEIYAVLGKKPDSESEPEGKDEKSEDASSEPKKVEDKNVEDDSTKKSEKKGGVLLPALAIIALTVTVAILSAVIFKITKTPSTSTDGTTETTVITVDTTQTTEITTEATTATTETTAVTTQAPLENINIAKAIINMAKEAKPEEDLTASVYLHIENVSEDAINTLRSKYGDSATLISNTGYLTVLVDAKVDQYFAKQGFASYMPKNTEEYSEKLLDMIEDYRTKNGVSPETQLMADPDYEASKSNRTAMLSIAAKYGLEEYYIFKTEGYDVAVQVEEYAESVRQQILASTNAVKFIEQQLAQNVVVFDENYNYTTEYYNFVVNNWLIIAAGC